MTINRRQYTSTQQRQIYRSIDNHLTYIVVFLNIAGFGAVIVDRPTLSVHFRF